MPSPLFPFEPSAKAAGHPSTPNHDATPPRCPMRHEIAGQEASRSRAPRRASMHPCALDCQRFERAPGHGHHPPHRPAHQGFGSSAVGKRRSALGVRPAGGGTGHRSRRGERLASPTRPRQQPGREHRQGGEGTHRPCAAPNGTAWAMASLEACGGALRFLQAISCHAGGGQAGRSTPMPSIKRPNELISLRKERQRV